jgi:hypothetical protein
MTIGQYGNDGRGMGSRGFCCSQEQPRAGPVVAGQENPNITASVGGIAAR